VFNKNVSDDSDELAIVGKQMIQGVMANNNSIQYDGMTYQAAVIYVFDRQIAFDNGTFPANATVCE
jgi:hypothetical protein